ncbi:MAG: hypothetical protein CM15mV143_240 [Caudoviricetes sp.]|nr:MAG: hypothetical protein CM15mV143_240 [Caudoviricetes sp.]
MNLRNDLETIPPVLSKNDLGKKVRQSRNDLFLKFVFEMRKSKINLSKKKKTKKLFKGKKGGFFPPLDERRREKPWVIQ